MLALHRSPLADSGSSLPKPPPRGVQVSVADDTVGGGHAPALSVGCIGNEILKPSRSGGDRPSETAGSVRPCAANAASIAHWFGVPFERLPSSSSASSTSAYEDGMSAARCITL